MTDKRTPRKPVRILPKVLVGITLAVLTLSAPLAASAGDGVPQIKVTRTMSAMVSWGGCGGCTQ